MSVSYYIAFAIALLLVFLALGQAVAPIVGWIGFGLALGANAVALFEPFPMTISGTNDRERWETEMKAFERHNQETEKQQEAVRRQSEETERQQKESQSQLEQSQKQMDHRARQLDAEEQKLQLELSNAERLSKLLTVAEGMASRMDAVLSRWESK
jgi:hypothetical protein